MSVTVRRATAVLAVALVTSSLLGGAALAAPAPSPSATAGPASDGGEQSSSGELVSFGIAPAGAERPDERPYVSVSAAPGTVVYDHVAVLNQAASPVALSVYSADVVQADGGGLAARGRTDTDSDAGAWIHVDAPGSVEVPAQTAETGYGFVIVPFSVTIPADAEPGTTSAVSSPRSRPSARGMRTARASTSSSASRLVSTSRSPGTWFPACRSTRSRPYGAGPTCSGAGASG